MSEEKTYDIKKRAYHFSKAIINLISKAKFDRLYFSIADQLLRSATSVGANLVEAKQEVQKEILGIFMQLH